MAGNFTLDMSKLPSYTSSWALSTALFSSPSFSSAIVGSSTSPRGLFPPSPTPLSLMVNGNYKITATSLLLLLLTLIYEHMPLRKTTKEPNQTRRDETRRNNTEQKQYG